MEDKDLSIFEDKDAVPSEPEETPAEEAQPEPEQAAPEPEPEAVQGEPEAAPPAADPEPEPTLVPVTAMLDEREKRQESQRQLEAAQAQANRLQQQLQAVQAQQNQQPAPDWLDDPQAAAAFQTQSIQAQLLAQNMQQSRFYAEREFGKELVAETYAFFDQHPHLSHQFASEPSPYHAAVEFYKKQKVFDQIGNDPEAWMEQQREAIRQEVMAAQPSQPRATQTPPASLSKAGASGALNEVAVKAPPNLNGLFNG